MDVLLQIDAIVAELQLPVTDAEKTDGWNEEYKLRVAQLFLRQKQLLLSEQPIQYFGLIRALDFGGISQGELLERIAKVEYAVNHRS
jgi:hypothetical protein